VQGLGCLLMPCLMPVKIFDRVLIYILKPFPFHKNLVPRCPPYFISTSIFSPPSFFVFVLYSFPILVLLNGHLFSFPTPDASKTPSGTIELAGQHQTGPQTPPSLTPVPLTLLPSQYTYTRSSLELASFTKC